MSHKFKIGEPVRLKNRVYRVVARLPETGSQEPRYRVRNEEGAKRFFARSISFHFTPTSASRLNAVEDFFAKLTRQRLKRGVFQSVVDLQLAINRPPPRGPLLNRPYAHKQLKCSIFSLQTCSGKMTIFKIANLQPRSFGGTKKIFSIAP